MDPDEVATGLYGVDPDDFVALRAQLVAQARAAKDRPLAAALAALRKPTRSAWLLNLLSRRSPSGLESLERLAGRLAAAHRAGDPAALRALGVERTTLVTRLSEAALAAGTEAGYRATEAVRQEVSNTLSAAVADPDVRHELLRGRLVKARVYSGFGLPASMPDGPGPDRTGTPPGGPVPASSGSPEHDGPRDLGRLDEARRQAVRRAQQELATAQAMLAEAGRAEQQARQRLSSASAAVAEQRAGLLAAEAAEAAAREAVHALADGRCQARAAVRQAEGMLDQAERALAAGET